MSQFSQDNVTLNPGVSGANVATDYVSSKDAHYQIVKLDFGAEDNSSLATLANPFPTNIVGINSSWQTLPVAGNTEGGAILITGTFGFTGSISGNDFNVGIIVFVPDIKNIVRSIIPKLVCIRCAWCRRT